MKTIDIKGKKYIPVDYELLCTKAEMLSQWIKEENIS